MSSNPQNTDWLSVSVLINNYNYGRFLREAIDSVLNQSYPHIEIIVVDDGSTDDSPEIIKSYGDRIIPVLKQNGGQASALNTGFEQSKGDILCFLDSDDIFLPNKVEKLVSWFNQITLSSPSVLIFNALEAIDDQSNPLDSDLLSDCCEWRDLQGTRARKKFLTEALIQVSTSAQVYKYARKYRYVPYLGSPTSGLAMTRALAARIFPLPWRNLKTSGDDFLVKAASLMGDIYSVEDALTQYRIHGNNSWYGNQKPVKREFLYAVDEFLNLKLNHSGKKPVLSYFNSVHAQVYYRGTCVEQQSYHKELLKLAVRVMSWHIDQRTVKLLIKAIYLSMYSRFRLVKTS